MSANWLSVSVSITASAAAFLNAGPGYGGSCFPKDTLALLRTAQDHGVTLRIVEETVAANEARKRKMALKVIDAVGGDVDGLTISVLGLTFKPDTDDMRDAPSVPLIETLQRFGATVRAHDPVGMENAARVLENVTFSTIRMSVRAAPTPWSSSLNGKASGSLISHRLRAVMRSGNLIDLRNAFARDAAQAAGFSVSSIGRPVPHRSRDRIRRSACRPQSRSSVQARDCRQARRQSRQTIVREG